MNSESIFDIAAKMAPSLDSIYKGTCIDRKNLREFFEVNGWFGITPGTRFGMPMITSRDLKKCEAPLILWLSAYKKPSIEKINLMLQHFSETYPVTCRLYRKFVWDKNIEDEASAWKLLDYLLSEIDCEITEYSEANLEKLVKPLDTETTLAVAYLLADFLRTAKYNGKPLTKWIYSFESRVYDVQPNDAYSAQDFAVMAYCTFNEEMWEKQCLIEKAIQSKKYAELWLFSALHFICALRISDMKRLPAPALPYSGETMLQKISSRTFSKQETAALADELVVRLKLKPMKPSKTSAHNNVPELKLFIPESLKAPLGLIMSISLAHHPEIKPGDSFVFSAYSNLNNIREFFGKDFTKALGNRHFLSLRCNKSYLQGLSHLAYKPCYLLKSFIL